MIPGTRPRGSWYTFAMNDGLRAPTPTQPPPYQPRPSIVRSAYETSPGFRDPDRRGPASSLWEIELGDEESDASDVLSFDP